MSIRQRSGSSPIPFHPLLSPLPPLLTVLNANLYLVRPAAVFRPYFLALTCVALGWGFLACLTGSLRKSAVVATLLTTATLSEFMWAPYRAGPIPVAWLVWAAVGAVCCVVLRRGGDLYGLTVFSNLVGVFTTALLAWPGVWGAMTQPSPHPRSGYLHSLKIEATLAPDAMPDVYVLILDGYGRDDVLRAVYGYPNPFASELRSLDFYIAEAAASNYSQTAQSVASMLNVDYLSALLSEADPGFTSRTGLGSLIADSRVFRAFRSAGYRVVVYESEYQLVRPEPADVALRPAIHLTDFEYGVYEGTVLPRFCRWLGRPPSWPTHLAHRYQVNWVLDRLTSGPVADGRPTLVFAHILLPHPPFVFGPQGEYRPTPLPGTFADGDEWRFDAQGTGENYVVGYVAGLRFLNGRLSTLVRRLTETSGRPAIIYLQGDHGPGSRLYWDAPSASDLRERLGILLAMRFPDGDSPPLYPAITPVNAMRVLLNRALGSRLPPLEDRAFFAGWKRPFDLVDVTGHVRPAATVAGSARSNRGTAGTHLAGAK